MAATGTAAKSATAPRNGHVSIPGSKHPAATSTLKAVPHSATIQELPNFLEIAQTPQTLEKELSLEQEGEKYFERKEYDKALGKWQEAYGMSLEMRYGDGEGRSLTNMSRLYMERGQAIKAKELGENALEILANSADQKSLGRARVALAQAYFALDNTLWAGQQLEMALKNFAEFGSSDAPEAARVMMLVGGLLVKLNKVRDAITFYQGAATYQGRAGDYLGEVSTRISLAGIMQELGWYLAAQEEAEKAVSSARLSKNPILVSSALASLGSCQYNLGEHANARISYEEAVISAIYSTTRSKAYLQSGFGYTLAATGDNDAGRQYLEAALPGLKTDGSVFSAAQAINVLGNLETQAGHYSRAVQLFNNALELQAICNPKQEKLGIIILQNLAIAQSQSGDNRNARASLESALAKATKFGDFILQGRILSGLTEVCLKQRDTVQAESYLQRGIAISGKINDDATLWRDYTILSQIQTAAGMNPQAHESLNSALSFFRSPQAGTFSMPEVLGYPSSREHMAHKLVSQLVTAGMLESALLAAEQIKEEAFINEWHRRGGLVRPEDKEIYTDLSLQRAHLHAAESTTTPDKLLKEWKTWQGRFQQLSTEDRLLSRLIAPVPTTFEQIVKEVATSHTPILDYLVGTHSTIAFTIDAAGKVNASILPVGSVQLQPQVTSLLSAINKTDIISQQNEKKVLRQLYSQLLPVTIQELLPKNPEQTIVIVPDGILFNLPFAALLDAQGKYLIENHTLTMASSIGVLLDTPTQQSSDLSLVVASGNPDDKDKKDSRATEESDQISSLFEPETVTKLLGKDADIANLEEQVKGKTIVHFPSNLSFGDNNPLASVIPLTASGNEQDNKVRANRLFTVKLPNDLAVWSSTSVSAKDLRGNAVKTFARGLSYAGVRNVLLSLWVEPDKQKIAQLMEFYRNNQQGLNQAQALRKAQMLALSKDHACRSWAAFQLLGPGY